MNQNRRDRGAEATLSPTGGSWAPSREIKPLMPQIYNDSSYRIIFNALKSINDISVREVKFGSDINGAITRDKKKHEAMLQGIEAHCHQFPKPTKKW